MISVYMIYDRNGTRMTEKDTSISGFHGTFASVDTDLILHREQIIK